MKTIENKDIKYYSSFTGNVVKRKRERRVICYPELDVHMKNWVSMWEHSKVTRHGFEIGYYDNITVPFFTNMVIEDGLDIGYCVKSGTVAGGSEDSWDYLIANVGKENLVNLFKVIVERSLEHKMIYTDLAPSNLIFRENKVCLIDLEGLESFSWLFEGKPLDHEAASRNLQKCDNPLWRGFDEYYNKFVREVIGIEDFKETFNCIKSIKDLYNIL